MKNVWDKVAKNFSEKGPKYWQWFGHQLVDHSAIEAGDKVLDIGCGRGASMTPALKKVGSSGLVVGMDASQEMIKENEKSYSDSNLKLVCSLLNEFEYEADAFDAVICGFGLPFIDHNKENYNVIKHVLKENGLFGISTWTHQADQDWLTALVNKHLEIENKPVKHTAYTTEPGVIETLTNAGFKSVETQLATCSFEFKSKEEWWEDLSHTAVKNILDALKEKGVLEAFKAEAFNGLEQYKKEGTIHIQRQAILAYCRL